MADAKLRRAIAFEAARLMYERTESEYFTAKRKAAARVCRGSVKPSDLPSNAEIRYHLAKVLAQSGRRTEAREELREAMKTGRPFEGSHEAARLLKALH